MSEVQNHGPSSRARADDSRPRIDEEYEAQIAALDTAPTGAPLTGKDWAFLGVTGLIAPVLLLIWGWV